MGSVRKWWEISGKFEKSAGSMIKLSVQLQILPRKACYIPGSHDSSDLAVCRFMVQISVWFECLCLVAYGYHKFSKKCQILNVICKDNHQHLTSFFSLPKSVDQCYTMYKVTFFSRGHATLHLAVSVGPSVGPSIRLSITFLNCERFLHYCSCPTVRDCLAVYPALLSCNVTLSKSYECFNYLTVK